MGRFEITFQPSGKREVITNKLTLLDAARKAGLGLVSICGGMGTCEECRIQLVSGKLSQPTALEESALEETELAQNWRLACQARPASDVTLFTPPESLSTLNRLQTEGMEKKIVPDPGIRHPGTFGLAVDIGTTKLAAYLISLETGRTLAKVGAINPQVSYGEDIINRIKFASMENRGGKLLQSILISAINSMLDQMCNEAHVNPSAVTRAVFVGNTVMHHLAAGLPTEQLGRAPFVPFTKKPITESAASLGLQISSTSRVYFPPVVAGYIGADHLAMLLSSGVGISQNERNKQSVIAIDIGTNTEITIYHDNSYCCCSCASGPAFEGAHIKEGMRAAPGAIERAHWNKKDKNILYQTIDNLAPLGICGSGILDIVASLMDGRQVKQSGALVTGNQYLIAPQKSNGINRDLVITREDIHEIQLAKSAIRAGVEVLLLYMKIDISEIDKFIIAGAFGTYLDLKSAIKVGMFPKLPLKKFLQVGNAAGIGAKQMLLSETMRKDAEDISARLQYVELATNKMFSEIYLQNLKLKCD